MRHRQFIEIFRASAVKAPVLAKELNHVAVPWTRAAGLGLHISVRQGPKPAPTPAGRHAAALDDLFHLRLAGRVSGRQGVEKRRTSHTKATTDCPDESHFA
jgi:hypothetical protein